MAENFLYTLGSDTLTTPYIYSIHLRHLLCVESLVAVVQMMKSGTFAMKLQGAAQACMRSIRSSASRESMSTSPTSATSFSSIGPSPDSVTKGADSTLAEEPKRRDATTATEKTKTSVHPNNQTIGSLDPAVLFNVQGLVVVVTGGGTGKCLLYKYDLSTDQTYND